ncbi:MAG: hypothetical protein HGA99_04610 [Chlorobiaceae bacterium]|nr:hypothetical protein [Chlorobiaceae bacterium]
MEKAVAYLVAHPVIFVIAVIISIIIVFSFLRRIMRLFIVVAAILVLYAAYLQLTGGHTLEAFQHLGQWFSNALHGITGMFGFLFDLLKFPKKG